MSDLELGHIHPIIDDLSTPKSRLKTQKVTSSCAAGHVVLFGISCAHPNADIHALKAGVVVRIVYVLAIPRFVKKKTRGGTRAQKDTAYILV